MHDFHPASYIHTKGHSHFAARPFKIKEDDSHACYYRTRERRCMSPSLTLTIVFPIWMQCAHSNWGFPNAPLSSLWDHSSECLLSSCFSLSLHRPRSKLAVNIVTLADWTSLLSEQHMDVWRWKAPQVRQHVFMSACSSGNVVFFIFSSISLWILTLHIHRTERNIPKWRLS